MEGYCLRDVQNMRSNNRAWMEFIPENLERLLNFDHAHDLAAYSTLQDLHGFSGEPRYDRRW